MGGQPDWQSLRGSAIERRHRGDIQEAVDELTVAIGLSKANPHATEHTISMLNYLADMYLDLSAFGPAEAAIREAIELSRPAFPILLAANLLVLADMLIRKDSFREAFVSAQEARQLYEEQGHTYGVGEADDLIGRIRPYLE